MLDWKHAHAQLQAVHMLNETHHNANRHAHAQVEVCTCSTESMHMYAQLEMCTCSTENIIINMLN